MICLVVLLCFCQFVSSYTRGIDSACCTNGFPDKVVFRVLFPRAGPATLIIPEMKFTCNGTIVGFTVAAMQQRGEKDPLIQVWRENRSQPGNYFKTGAGVAIDDALCVDGLTEVSDRVFYCNLNETYHQLLVQPGDILGLELPSVDEDDIILAFARVSRGPTNYVFEQQFISSSIVFSNATSVNNYLPQIALKIKSDSDSDECVNGFPDIPVSAVSTQTRPENVITRIIPGMNFTCISKVVGFIAAGMQLNGEPDAKIQIWRQNTSQPFLYHKIEADIALNREVCVYSRQIAGNTFWCILAKDLQVIVQPGDILGLELPNITNSEIFFTANGGPVNYVFQHKLDSILDMSSGNYTEVTQLPQIAFNLTSDQCLVGFPSNVSMEGRGRGSSSVTSRLIPDLKFGCHGTIVGLTMAVALRDGQQDLKVQLWRENITHSHTYYRSGSDIPIVRSNPPCIRGQYTSRSGIYRIFECVLSEEARLSVQPGDILGLTLPPTTNTSLEIQFTIGGPTNYVFQRQLPSNVNFAEADFDSSDLPQITFLVVLDESVDSSCVDTLAATSAAVVTITSIHDNVMLTDVIPMSLVAVNAMALIVGGVVAVIVVLGLVSIIVLLVVVFIHHNKHKVHSTNNHDLTYPNPVFERDVKDGTAADYDEIDYEEKAASKAVNNLIPTIAQSRSNNYYSTSQTLGNELHIDENEALSNDQNYVGTLEMQTYSPVQTVATSNDDDTYWEPATTVNELYRQLSSKKYREIGQHEVKITNILGTGQFGEVCKGTWQSPMGAMNVAVKQLHQAASEEEKIKFLQEAAINGQFRHPNVVQLMGVVTVGELTMIVLELLSNGDLRTFLIKQQPLSENPESSGADRHMLLRFCQQITTGMGYLASKAFVHRDLAARNILVSEDKICKISDFGMSRDLMDENYYVSHGGKVPVKWTAPEAIHYRKYSTASDVWSFGCVMYETWSLGHKPFENHTNAEVVRMVDKGYRLPPPPGLPKELYKIMIQCWQPDSFQRPTFPQLVEMLSRADFELFSWEEEDLRDIEPQAKMIGAPLETAKNLFRDLQRSYC